MHMMKSYITIIMLCCISLSCSQIPPKNMNFHPGQQFYYSDEDYLNYEVHGNGKIPIIFIHGFGASLRNWDDVIDKLPRDIFTSYSIDLKGSGFSSTPHNSHYSIKDNAELISQFIRYKELKDYIVVGHSMGGGIALLVAMDFENSSKLKPKKLILLDPSAYKIELPFFIQYLRIPIISKVLYFLTSHEFKVKYSLKRIVYDCSKINSELINRYAAFMYKKGSVYAVMQTAYNIVPQNFEQYTSKYKYISLPVLVIWGKEDPAIPLSVGQQLVQEIPVARLSVIEKCGHNPHEEYPQKIADLIYSFATSSGE